MEFGGRYLVSAPRQTVWAALNNADTLRATIPGCSRIEWTGDTSLEIEITVNFGIVKPTFAGDLTLSNVIPAQSYTLAGKGRGGVLGMAQGAADITLADAPEGTLLQFTANGGADGGIMKLGRALVGNSAQKVIDGFFARFGVAMGAEVRPVTG
ncbi:MAG TPA: carbon monoxide dehydrogenase subunit G [Devosia sp.]